MLYHDISSQNYPLLLLGLPWLTILCFKDLNRYCWIFMDFPWNSHHFPWSKYDPSFSILSLPLGLPRYHYLNHRNGYLTVRGLEYDIYHWFSRLCSIVTHHIPPLFFTYQFSINHLNLETTGKWMRCWLCSNYVPIVSIIFALFSRTTI